MIPFTQYLLPDGRTRPEEIDRSPEIEAMACALIADGCVFEIEMLSTGEISLEVLHGAQSLAGRVCANGPAVPKAVDAIVREAHAQRI